MGFLWTIVTDNWAIIMMAPVLFVAALFLGWLAGWMVIRLVYNQRLAHQADMITNLRAVLEEKLPPSFLPLNYQKRSKRMSFGLVLIFFGIGAALLGALIVAYEKPSASVSRTTHNAGVAVLQSTTQDTSMPLPPIAAAAAQQEEKIGSRAYPDSDKNEISKALSRLSGVLNKQVSKIASESNRLSGAWEQKRYTAPGDLHSLETIIGLIEALRPIAENAIREIVEIEKDFPRHADIIKSVLSLPEVERERPISNWQGALGDASLYMKNYISTYGKVTPREREEFVTVARLVVTNFTDASTRLGKWVVDCNSRMKMEEKNIFK
ncbi:hypothetical protein KMZ93_13375 [Bradyrhizobium sediminis]|uniref:Uncharacterized protein n=1 Tax=Bradyrhizobium sediminis TaxID=2840469 RepID=A0A975NUY4_9BRAD|nr:hypothetical protein [Bradyrhizobium sediminis]QWG21054.1 hypothetical protein KMZ93_13375 [Bradyrhizobium sediminis]